MTGSGTGIYFLWLFPLCVLSAAADAKWIGSKACAQCHAAIFRQYSSTPMALSSGPAGASAASEKFDHASFEGNSGYRYSVTDRNHRLFLEFRKAGAARAENRELSYFVGSGAAARSYLIAVDSFLYEAPASYYSRGGMWSFSPGYERYTYPFLTRAIAPGCLECHATGVNSVAGTQNGYGSPPFLEGGVGCERCHGPGARHAASAKAVDIVSPAKLSADRRNSVCGQCHLSGTIRVERAGKTMSQFVAGEKLSDYAIAFVAATAVPGMKVTSHVENLAQSACSRSSGDRLWCGTCHDPHFVPSSTEKAAWFRSKCQTCHAPAVCARGPNCIGCHMPASSVTDAEHVVYTDHSIPRRPTPRTAKPPANAALAPFGGAQATPRDLGLAYAIVALREQNADYQKRAFDLLREANGRDPDEPQTLAYLADLYKTRKDDGAAASLYAKLRAADPTQSSAPANLGAYQMEQGHYDQAIRLFRDALRISPALVLVRFNLAVALVRTGQRAEARAALEKALEFNPTFTAARELLGQIAQPKPQP
jgi:Flp pilus assembly protein TadD